LLQIAKLANICECSKKKPQRLYIFDHHVSALLQLGRIFVNSASVTPLRKLKKLIVAQAALMCIPAYGAIQRYDKS